MLFINFAVILIGCEDEGTGLLVCTGQFVIISLEVHNSEGKPIESTGSSPSLKLPSWPARVTQNPYNGAGSGCQPDRSTWLHFLQMR